MSEKNSAKKSRLRLGARSLMLCAVVIAAAIVLNAVAARLPSSAMELDISNNRLLSLSDQTKEIVGSLSQQVDVYWIVQSGREDVTLGTLLDRYDELSDSLTVTHIDPLDNPNFVVGYEEELKYNNSLLVSSGGHSIPVPFTDIYVYDEASASYYSSFNGENALTSAIYSLTSGVRPMVYVLEGHGEQSLTETNIASLSGQGYDVSALSIIAAQEIPADCALLLIYDPQTDISDFEYGLLRRYIDGGGSVLLMTSYTAGRMERLESLMEESGVSRFGSIVVDPQQFVSSAPVYLLPSISEHAITTPFMGGSYYAVLPLCQALVVDERLPGGVTVEPLLVTSESGIAKLDASDLSVIRVDEGDLSGVLSLAVAIETGSSRAVWVASSYLVEENAVSWSAGTNNDLFLNAVNWLCSAEDSISIHPKPIDMTETLIIPANAGRAITAFIVFVIPLAVLAAGLAVVIVRRRR